MRTTLDIDDELLRAAKSRAVAEGTSLTATIERALRLLLRPPRRTAPAFRFEPVVKRGAQPPPFDIADRDPLYARMEDRG